MINTEQKKKIKSLVKGFLHRCFDAMEEEEDYLSFVKNDAVNGQMIMNFAEMSNEIIRIVEKYML